MANELNRPNDIFVSTLVNGELDPLQLNAHNITAQNTEFLTPAEYKDSPFVQKAFSDENGNFDTLKFENAYLTAAKQYENLIQDDSYKKLENYVEYNINDIFAPLGSKKQDMSYTMQNEINPHRVSEGVTSLFGLGERDKSDRELAQQSLIYDWDKQEWLDTTADDRGLLGSVFGKSLVYATWDEDGVHEDPISGRQIKHKKGEWKLNDKGQFYTETLGSRSGYGKQFVAASDTLTKEDSALNKFDFFDSDGLSKSPVGTTFKAMAKIAPYMIPGVNVVWGGTTAAIQLAGVMPTFAKMLEGIAVGGDSNYESDFTKQMNRWENYFKKFDPSYSDDAQGSNWGYQQIANTVSDIFGQLYQMRAAASISKLVKTDPTNKAIESFRKEMLPKYIQASAKNGSGLELSAKEFNEIATLAAQKSPSIQKAIEAQSKLSKSLSLGYMALTSSADVYQDALEGGYDRRMAGLAGLAATAGQYGIMMSEDVLGIGDWFLDKTVGYSTRYNKNLIKRALRPYYDEFAKAAKQIEVESTTKGKLAALGSAFKKANSGMKQFFQGVKDGTEPLWKNAIVEAVEEVTEEAVMDATKGIFDTLTWLGVGSNKDASFGGWKNVFSAQGLERYALNAFGGFLGGSLFELQNTKIEPWITAKISGQVAPEVQPSLVHEIANGHTAQLLEEAEKLGDLDNEVASANLNINGTIVNPTATQGQQTRGQIAAKALQNYIKMLEGIIVDENANLNDSQVMQKAVRDYQAIKLLEKSNISKLVINDFTKLTSDIASIIAALKSKQSTDEDKNKQESVDTKTPEQTENADVQYDTMSAAALEKELDKKRKELQAFLNGDNGEEYLKKSLAFLIPEIREAAQGGLSKYLYTELKYDKNYADLPDSQGTLTKQQIDKEYDDWKNIENEEEKFLTLGVATYDDFIKKFQDSVYDYAKDNYLDVAAVVKNNLINHTSLVNTGGLDEDESYEDIKKIANGLKSEGYSGITLESVFNQNTLKLRNSIAQLVEDNPKFIKALQLAGKSKTEFINAASEYVGNILSNIHIDELSGLTLEAILGDITVGFLKPIYDNLKENNSNLTLSQLQQYLIDNQIVDTPIIFNAEDAETVDTNVLYNYFRNATKLQVKSDAQYNIGIASSLLENYITEEKVLDAVIVKRVSENALRNLLQKINSLNHNLKGQSPLQGTVQYYDGSQFIFTEDFELDSDSIKQLYDRVNTEFTTKSLDNIVEEWLFDQNKGIIKTDAFFKSIPDLEDVLEFTPTAESDIKTSEELTVDNVAKSVKNKILKLLKSDALYNIYTKVADKPTKQNSIYDSLENIDLTLSEGKKSKVLELLRDQHNKIRHAEKFEDYLPQGKEKETLQNALQAIRLYKAVVIGMRESDLDLGNPFNYAQQIKRFLTKNGKESQADKYKLINEVTSKYILDDLTTIENQIKGYLVLGERAGLTKAAEDNKVRAQYSNLILNHILNEGTKLTIRGVSIIPPKQELDKYDEDSEKLQFLSHYIYLKFNELAKTPEGKRLAIQELLDSANIDFNELQDRGLQASNLNGELKTINSRDFINWLAMSLGADSFEFAAKYDNAIIGNSENTTVPLFSQEVVMQQTWSFVNDDKQVKTENGSLESVHSAIMRYIRTKFDANTPTIDAPNIFFVNGITGAGKTSAVGSSISAMSDGKILYVSAPSQTQVDNYLNSIKKYNLEPDYIQSGIKEALLNLFLTREGQQEIRQQIEFLKKPTSDQVKEYLKNPKAVLKQKVFDLAHQGYIWELDPIKLEAFARKKVDPATLPQIILIDEGTHFNQPELQILNYFADKFDIKIVLSGDSLQRGQMLDGDSQAMKDINMWTSSRLNISIRASNAQKANNNREFNKGLYEYERLSTASGNLSVNDELDAFLSKPENQLHISYYEDDNTLVGDKFVDNLLNSTADLSKMISQVREENQKNPEQPSKLAIITKLDMDGNPKNEALINALKTLGLQATEYELYSPEDFHPRAVQGAESKFVIVDEFDWGTNKGENLRSLYTYASRSLKGSLIQVSKDKLYELHIINSRDSRTQIDEVPQLAQRQLLKDKRHQSLQKLLEGTNYDITPKKIKTQKVNDKEVPVREVIKTSTVKKEETKKSSTKTATEEPSEEQFLSTEDFGTFVSALNENPDDSSLDESGVNMTNEDSQTRYIKSKLGKSNIHAYPAIDHLGVQKIDYFYQPQNTGINLDLDGLTQPGRQINQYAITGFLKFRNLISMSSSRDEVIDGIRNDLEIGYFLSEICQVAFQTGKDLYGDISGLSPYRSLIMSEWADKNLIIDDNVYVIAKRFDSDTDLASTIANADASKTAEDGKVQLYYGVKVSSKDGAINQWITLGSLPNKTYVDKDGNVQEYELQEFKNLYKAAEQQITPDNKVPIAVFKLPNANVWNLQAASTLWFKRQPDDENGKFYESVLSAKRRGIVFDEDNVFLIDSQKVLVDGQEEYKALVILAGLDLQFTQDPDNKKFGMKSLSFKDKLTRLHQQFVYKDEDGNEHLSIAGKYMTFVNFVNLQNDNSDAKAFRRVAFLSPSTNSGISVFRDLDYTVAEKDSDSWRWVNRLAKARPYSQTQLIVQLLQHVDAFRNNNLLYKYVLAWRQKYETVTKGKATGKHDTEVLKKLVDFVKNRTDSSEIITPDEFANYLNEQGHRALLMPFCMAFVGKTGSDYYMSDISKTTKLIKASESEIGEDTLEYISSGTTKIKINKDRLPDAYTSLPISNISDSVTTQGRTNIDSLFFNDQFSDIADVRSINSEDQKPLSMFKVAYSSDFDKMLGFSEYQLQMFQVNFSAEELSNPEFIQEYRLEQLPDEQRFVENVYLDIPQRPEDFDPYLYTPKKLSITDFEVTKEMAKYAVYDEGKTEYKIGKRRVRGKLISYRYAVKSKKFKGFLTEKRSGKRRVPIALTNSQGFEVRVGDTVMLWGYENTSYRIGRVDLDKKMVGIIASGDSLGNQEENFGSLKYVPVDAVTAVIKRRVSSKDQIVNDVYYTGKFDTQKINKKPEFLEKVKSFDTFSKFYEKGSAEDVFEFSKYWYLLVPIDKQVSDIRHPLRFATDKKLNIGEILPNTYVDNEQGLIETVQSLKDSNEYGGVTIYRIKRKNVTPEGTVYGFNPNEIGQKFYDAIIDAERLQQSTGKGSYIAHQVFFDKELMSGYQNKLKEAAKSSILYDPEEVAKSFSSPEEKLNLVDPRKKADIKYYEIPYSDFLHKNDKDFPYQLFYRELISDKDGVTKSVRFYPRIAFYKGYNKNGINHSGFLKGIEGVTTKFSYDEFIMGDDLDYSNVRDRFKELIGCYVQDILDIESKRGEKDQKALIPSTTIKIENGKQVLRGRKLLITDIKPSENDVYIYYQLPNLDTQSKIPLVDFLIELGSRYIILDQTKAIINQPEIKSENVASNSSVADPFATIVEDVINSNKEPIIETNDSEDIKQDIPSKNVTSSEFNKFGGVDQSSIDEFFNQMYEEYQDENIKQEIITVYNSIDNTNDELLRTVDGTFSYPLKTNKIVLFQYIKLLIHSMQLSPSENMKSILISTSFMNFLANGLGDVFSEYSNVEQFIKNPQDFLKNNNSIILLDKVLQNDFKTFIDSELTC